ncbi:hypothetical protein F5884DRAFT_798301 [Xylogone sp. PMI_703]|nr:hypothetical protein F5884DRAFT_798301 [Xylogone sp. PMI_703]
MRTLLLLFTALLTSVAYPHTVITYPGDRGNNLITNQTFPYAMQWVYPCGGMSLSRNRTKWPINGGAIALQPGHDVGHSKALFYINMGFGTDGPDGGPLHFNHPLITPFQIHGPSNNAYPGTFCLPHVPPPANVSIKVGDFATIQVLMTAQHGASLCNCVDIEFVEPADAIPVDYFNTCFNSSDISFYDIFLTKPYQNSF